MKRARFSEEQIIAILKEAEGGAKVTELCRRHGISDATFYTWRSKVRRSGSVGDAPAAPARGGESAAEVDRGRSGTGYSGSQGRIGKKRLRPAVKRAMVVELMTTHDLSHRRACGLIGITRRHGRGPYMLGG
jgi:putative transposase